MERVNGEPRASAADAWRTVEGAVERGAQDVRSWLRAADTWTRRMTEQKPLLALGVALAAGYVIGRVFAYEED